jgi:hypothetical protein
MRLYKVALYTGEFENLIKGYLKFCIRQTIPRTPRMN